MVNENHDKVESMFVIKITFLAVILSSFIYYIFISLHSTNVSNDYHSPLLTFPISFPSFL